MSATNLAKKLGIKPGDRVWLIEAPSGTAEYLRRGCPEGVSFVERLPDDKVEIVLYWPRGLEGLTDRFRDLQHRIVPTGAVWAVIPKKKYARKWGIDFSWEELQAAGLQTDLVDNKVASIDEETYGTRFVIRVEYRDKYRD
ncbi:MAG: hypothetical protein P8X95_08675 [Anaerolineales bacterium]